MNNFRKWIFNSGWSLKCARRKEASTAKKNKQVCFFTICKMMRGQNSVSRPHICAQFWCNILVKTIWHTLHRIVCGGKLSWNILSPDKKRKYKVWAWHVLVWWRKTLCNRILTTQRYFPHYLKSNMNSSSEDVFTYLEIPN